MKTDKNIGEVIEQNDVFIIVNYHGKKVVVSKRLPVQEGEKVQLVGLKITENNAWARSYQPDTNGISLAEFKRYDENSSHFQYVDTICIWDSSRYFSNISTINPIISIGIGSKEKLGDLEEILAKRVTFLKEKDVSPSYMLGGEIIANVFYHNEPITPGLANPPGILFFPVNRLSRIIVGQRNWDDSLSQTIWEYLEPFQRALETK